jgi:hypothetical protein
VATDDEAEAARSLLKNFDKLSAETNGVIARAQDRHREGVQTDDPKDPTGEADADDDDDDILGPGGYGPGGAGPGGAGPWG